MIYKFQSHHWSAKRSANLELVCSCWCVLTKHKHRRPAELLISTTVKMCAAQLRANETNSHHTPFPTPHFGGSQLSVCCLGNGHSEAPPKLSCSWIRMGPWNLYSKWTFHELNGWSMGHTLKNTNMHSICDKTLVIVCDFMVKFYAKKAFK